MGMTYLLVGLAVFLGVHSTRILSERFRKAMVARLGLNRWKGLHSAVSITGFVLVVWGFGQARAAAVPVCANGDVLPREGAFVCDCDLVSGDFAGGVRQLVSWLTAQGCRRRSSSNRARSRWCSAPGSHRR